MLTDNRVSSSTSFSWIRGHPFLIGEVWVAATTMNIRIFGTTNTKNIHPYLRWVNGRYAAEALIETDWPSGLHTDH